MAKAKKVLPSVVFEDLATLQANKVVHLRVNQELAITAATMRPGQAAIKSVTIPAANAASLSQPAFTQAAALPGQAKNTQLEALLKAEQAGTVEVTVTLHNASIYGDPVTSFTVEVVIL